MTGLAFAIAALALFGALALGVLRQDHNDRNRKGK